MSWLKPRYSRDTEPRERYGPMDIDEPNPLSRLEQYAVQDNDYGEGPSRKRLHSDIHTPTRPFTSNNKTIHVTPSTPFLFNISNLQVPDLPAQRSFQYDPTDFQGPNKLDWGFGKVENRFGIEDVEMSESPVKPGWASHLSFDPPLNPVSTTVKAAGKEENMEQVDDSPNDLPPISHEDEVKKEEEKVTSEDPEGDQMPKSDMEKTQNTNRVYATGGVKREMRNRSKKKQNRNENNTREKEEYRRVDPAHSLKHSEIPALILGYIQVFVNVAIVIFALYLGIHLVLTIQRDVKDRMQEASLEMRQEIAECTKLFVTNRCDPEFRVPAMEDHCRNWETCMNRDPTMVGRINVMAETFAGVINSFVEAMSWKTMGFTLATLSFLIILTNSALWNLRQKASPDPSHPPPVYMLPHPSLTRQLQIGNHISHLGQTMGSVGQPLDWHGMMGDSNVKQIEYGEKKKKWGIW